MRKVVSSMEKNKAEKGEREGWEWVIKESLPRNVTFKKNQKPDRGNTVGHQIIQKTVVIQHQDLG